jgi:hypothetical protein
MKNLLEAGYLDGKQEVVNHDVEKKIEEYLDTEIKKAIAKGELPPVTKARAIHKKLRQFYGKRKTEDN